MRSLQAWRIRSLVASFLLALVASLVLAAQPASAEYCGPQMPEQVRFARGYTFIGTLTEMRRGGTPAPSWDFRVERIFAGSDRLPPPTDPAYVVFEPGEITSLDGRCYPPRGLRIGTRYLVSDATLATFSSMSTVVWEVLPHGRVRLLRQYGSRGMDPRFASPTTVAEAVALMARGAELPPTDVLDSAAGTPDRSFPSGLVMLAGLLGAVAWWGRGRSLDRGRRSG
jgi:hypothetical protein